MLNYNNLNDSIAGSLFELMDRNNDRMIDFIDLTDILNVFNKDTSMHFIKLTLLNAKKEDEYLVNEDLQAINEFSDLILSLCHYG